MRVLVTASGTGGHLMPAKYVIDHLIEDGATVSFLGSGRPLEEEILAPLEIPRYVIPARGIRNRGVVGVLQFLFGFPKALWKTWSILRSLKPDVILGTGGYVTFYPVLCGFLMRVPSWIHEAEKEPGLANNVLSLFAGRISTAYPETSFLRNKNTVFTGHPVREDLNTVQPIADSVTRPVNLLVLGGSQGASVLDNTLFELVPQLKDLGLSIWHQCRTENVARLTSRYSELGVEHRVMNFIHELPEAYSWSHLIVSRAGAGSVMELGIIGRPALLVPLPHVDRDHQTRNAELLSSQGKAVIVSEGEGFSERLMEQIRLCSERNEFRRRLEVTTDSRPRDAAKRIADGVLTTL